MASAIAYYVQGLCMRVKGPVFATAFNPLIMIIVAVMGSIILSEAIYLGRFVISNSRIYQILKLLHIASFKVLINCTDPLNTVCGEEL